MTYPIPKEILIHSCRLDKYPLDGTQGGEPVSSQILSNVRLSVRSRRRNSPASGHTEESGVLYYDCVNSSPEDVTFMEDGVKSVVFFNGRAFSVTAVKYIYGADRLHHLEVILGSDT